MKKSRLDPIGALLAIALLLNLCPALCGQTNSAWSAEYARRVGKAMDIMLRNKVKHVLWIELPDMRDEKVQADMLQINAIIMKEADARPGVTFVPCKQLLSRKPGTYSNYLLQSDGMPLTVRDGGVHLNRAGAELLADFIIAKMNSNPDPAGTPQ